MDTLNPLLSSQLGYPVLVSIQAVQRKQQIHVKSVGEYLLGWLTGWLTPMQSKPWRWLEIREVAQPACFRLRDGAYLMHPSIAAKLQDLSSNSQR